MHLWSQYDTDRPACFDPQCSWHRIHRCLNKTSRIAQAMKNNNRAFTATATKCQSGVLFILDLDQCIQNHGTALTQIHLIRLHLWLILRLFWVLVKSLHIEQCFKDPKQSFYPAINLKFLDVGGGFGSRRCGGHELRIKGQKLNLELKSIRKWRFTRTDKNRRLRGSRRLELIIFWFLLFSG